MNDWPRGITTKLDLSLLPWNLMNNDVVALTISEKTTIVGFSDDMTLISIENLFGDVEFYSTERTSTMRTCITNCRTKKHRQSERLWIYGCL